MKKATKLSKVISMAMNNEVHHLNRVRKMLGYETVKQLKQALNSWKLYNFIKFDIIKSGNGFIISLQPTQQTYYNRAYRHTYRATRDSLHAV